MIETLAPPTSSTQPERLRGCLLGLAVGDAIGLPFEGLSARRVERLLRGRGLRHRFLFGRGMFSDDTEHACMTLQAWRVGRGDIDRFAHALGWNLRWWLAGVPAGTGFATLRSILKLWLGFPPARSGVFSAGNGPCMRAPVLGVMVEESHLPDAVAASTQVTHTDPRAYEGALVVAYAANVASRHADVNAGDLIARLSDMISGTELKQSLELARVCLSERADPREFAARLGISKGVSGYVNHSVPCALYCWLKFPGDFRGSLEAIIRLGGDTDTTAAITGALAGAQLGVDAIPQIWRDGICDWPRSAPWVERLAASSTEQPLFWPAIPLRNAAFLMIVLMHGLRRCLPPYG